MRHQENKRKLLESILPYNAYKVLGVSPTVTKDQLKSTFRRLAKLYHPDKFHGQSEENIKKARSRFQEISQAYKTILKHKQLK
jgi:DnaJ-class molecular chaperone